MDLSRLVSIGLPEIVLVSLYAMTFILPLLMGIYLLKNFISHPKRIPKNTDYPAATTKFAVLIPACNEAVVIAKTIALIKGLHYPKELYEIIVIADNCTDETAAEASKTGVKVFERNDPLRKSKAFALKWFFDTRYLQKQKFDAICLVDADTILETAFLMEINRELALGYPVVYGRSGSINTYDSFTSSFMSVLLSFQNRIWHLPQSQIPRSGFFAGTGVCITVKCLEDTGWDIHTLVEDAEFGIQVALKGGLVKYCDNATFYVEQVNSFKDLWKQQRRWRTGHINCLKRYGGKLFRSIFFTGNKNSLAPLLLVLIPPFCITSVLQAILAPLVIFTVLGKEALNPLAFTSALIIQFAFSCLFQSVILLLDDRFSFRHWKGITLMFIAPILYGIVDITSIIKPVKNWNLMNHGNADYNKKQKQIED